MASKKKKSPHDTPAMQQFKRFKQQYPDCVLFFRMGDFYEMFYDDAVLANKVLGVTLTQRTEGIPMAGVPYHSVDGYLRRMIQAGHRVAVCDQIENPAEAKGVVKRDVTRVITPGTLTDEMLLEEGATCPLAAVMFHGESKPSSTETASVAWVDLSTGAFSMATFDVDTLPDEVARINPSELLYVETADREPPARVKSLATANRCPAIARPAWHFRPNEANETLQKQFHVATLSGFGLTGEEPALGPAAAIVSYLLETQKIDDISESDSASRRTDEGDRRTTLAHLRPPKLFHRDEHLLIDQTSLRSLEIEQTLRANTVEGSLLYILQSCRTAMGKRLLRQWLCYPLCDRQAIEARQRIVGAMVDDTRFLDDLRDVLDDIQDIQRIVSRIAVGRATPRDLVALGGSTGQAKRLLELLDQRPPVAAFAAELSAIVETVGELSAAILDACIDAPPNHLREGGLFRDGYDKQLDESRSLQRDSNQWLAEYQRELIEQTDVNTLKVGYNKVFGYYIELSAANRDKAPDNWTRKQTLKNAERFITPELKEYEGKVLTAKDRAVTREQQLFNQLCENANKRLAELHTLAESIAQLDVLACFAHRAVRHRYVKPTIVDEPVLNIEGGRHPVLDELLGDQFVPNEVDLGASGVSADQVNNAEDSSNGDDEKNDSAESATRRPNDASPTASLALITGPNMAGKSTYIRQAALLTLLAHTGSFVPADAAVVGLCDRIFTRIGASDELHAGQSTFMVEMTETANICHHATARSLVILDEIGRGTSTYDGLSLAWAIAEHLANVKSRTLFATHYHELTELSERFDNVINLNVTVREWQGQIVFLHRIVTGATNRSYGIHVARIAGLPGSVIDRANALLDQLEQNHHGPTAINPTHDKTAPTSPPQMSLFTEYMNHPVIDDLSKIDLNTLTPMQAFDLLRQLKERLEE